MSAIKDGRYPVELDRTRHLLFSLNAIDEIQDKFGSIEKVPEALKGKNSLKNLKWLLTLLLNEGAAEDEEPLTERQVGKLIHSGNLVFIQDSIYKAFGKGTSGDEEPEESEDNEKNVKSV